MLVLTQGQSGVVVVTLNEKRTLSDGFYLFWFEHITTRETTVKVFAFAEDESSYTTRFNQFAIPSSVFEGKSTGEWAYRVYETAVSTTDPEGLTEVENGLLKLNPATEFAFTEYEQETNYKAYGG